MKALSDDSTLFIPFTLSKRLPSIFQSWESVLVQLPQLNSEGTIDDVRSAVRSIPIIPDVQSHLMDLEIQFLRRAHVILSFLVQSFVNGGHVDAVQDLSEVPVVPRMIAQPFYLVSEILGMKPMFSACTFDTWNWEPKVWSSPLTWDNLCLLNRLTLENAEIGFHIIPCAMHIAAAQKDDISLGDRRCFDNSLFKKVLKVPSYFHDGQILELVDVFIDLRKLFKKFIDIFKHVYEVVDFDSFARYRRMLRGFSPNGIHFDVGGSKGIVLNKSKGPSAAQTSMFFLFDALLKIDHRKSAKVEQEKVTESSIYVATDETESNAFFSFQNEMLLYLPSEQRNLILQFQESMKNTNIEQYLENKDLKKEFQNCMRAYRAFRQYHLKVALFYLDDKSTGTGSSKFRSLLQEAIDNTF